MVDLRIHLVIIFIDTSPEEKLTCVPSGALLCGPKPAAVFESQIGSIAALSALTDADHGELWGTQNFFRVYSTVSDGRKLETDLFEGLRYENEEVLYDDQPINSARKLRMG